MSSEADTFVTIESDGEKQSFPIERLGVCGFGRATTNSVVLNDERASREHAMIRRNATGHCMLTDLGSTNGTRLNGRQVSTPMPLKSGDIIGIGRQTIAFQQLNAPQQLADPNAGRTQFQLEHQLVSCLVIDMRGYTPLSAQLGPERTTALMAEIFREAGAMLDRHGCWSAKFIGDAVMAVWVHPSNTISRADIVQAFDVISAFQEIFAVAARHYETGPLQFGCGLNVGMASTGNLGSAAAADFTAMGEAVNLAFRLESAAKEHGYDVMIAREVFEALADGSFDAEPIVEVRLKGYEDRMFPACALRFADIGPLAVQLIGSAAGAPKPPTQRMAATLD